MMGPLNQQINEMKVMYESTKACSGAVDNKIDELKRVLAMQVNTLQNGHGTVSMGGQQANYNPTIAGMFNK